MRIFITVAIGTVVAITAACSSNDDDHLRAATVAGHYSGTLTDASESAPSGTAGGLPVLEFQGLIAPNGKSYFRDGDPDSFAEDDGVVAGTISEFLEEGDLKIDGSGNIYVITDVYGDDGFEAELEVADEIPVTFNIVDSEIDEGDIAALIEDNDGGMAEVKLTPDDDLNIEASLADLAAIWEGGIDGEDLTFDIAEDGSFDETESEDCDISGQFTQASEGLNIFYVELDFACGEGDSLEEGSEVGLLFLYPGKDDFGMWLGGPDEEYVDFLNFSINDD